MLIDLLIGAAIQSTPPSGTWWVDDQPKSFQQHPVSVGIGLRGQNWSVAAMTLGRETGNSIACSDNNVAACPHALSHWNTSQAPKGVWGAWEPSYRGAFVQVGGGVYWPDFRMTVPDWFPSGPGTVARFGNKSNNKMQPGYLGGIGYHVTDRIDVLANVRYSRAPQAAVDTGTSNVEGLSRNTYWVGVRYGF